MLHRLDKVGRLLRPRPTRTIAFATATRRDLRCIDLRIKTPFPESTQTPDCHFTPRYAAQVGHWSEMLVPDVQRRVGQSADPEQLKPLLKEVAGELELLAGQYFGGAELRTVSIDSGGLPFVFAPGFRTREYRSDQSIWPVLDPSNPEMASVIQVLQAASLPPHAAPIAGALQLAGDLVVAVNKGGVLSADWLRFWLQKSFDQSSRAEFFKGLLDPNHLVFVPLAGIAAGGWWFQITRRITWITGPRNDIQQLVEPLIGREGPGAGLVGVEPVLIVARLTAHPVDRALAFRIWPGITRNAERPWRFAAQAVHSHGVPILTLDERSSASEVGCQLLLLAQWHGLLDASEGGLAEAFALAYPKAVERVRAAMHMPDSAAAAATLLEGLLKPGFDPARGAESTRRYVSRKATLAILAQNKFDDASLRPWDAHGISERYYYKLLKRFAPREAGRYIVDESVRQQIHSYLQIRDARMDKKTQLMDLLLERGFAKSAARKWLYRHTPQQALTAWPRASRRRPFEAVELKA